MNIAVIPARGGSKRIPRKNIKPFCGKPMIAWSIAAAIESRCFDHVIVSTDDDEIAEVARAYGAEVPFRRPDHLSDDHTATVPVIAHAIAWQRQRSIAQYACCIYATAPFLRPETIREGLVALETSRADYAASVATFPFPIERALSMDTDARVAMVHPQHLSTRSQDLTEVYHDAGQLYWGTAEAWLGGWPIFGAMTVGLRLPRKRVQDIDTPEDWERAELVFRALIAEESGCPLTIGTVGNDAVPCKSSL